MGFSVTHLQRRGLLQGPPQALHILLAQPPSPQVHKGRGGVWCALEDIVPWQFCLCIWPTRPTWPSLLSMPHALPARMLSAGCPVMHMWFVMPFCALYLAMYVDLAILALSLILAAVYRVPE